MYCNRTYAILRTQEVNDFVFSQPIHLCPGGVHIAECVKRRRAYNRIRQAVRDDRRHGICPHPNSSLAAPQAQNQRLGRLSRTARGAVHLLVISHQRSSRIASMLSKRTCPDTNSITRTPIKCICNCISNSTLTHQPSVLFSFQNHSRISSWCCPDQKWPCYVRFWQYRPHHFWSHIMCALLAA